jgi:hypothetical protein
VADAVNMTGFCPWSSVLVLTDGQKHSEKAVRWACLAASLYPHLELTILHVKDPYLKQFYNEIYSQGRRQYLEHVENELQKQAQTTLQEARKIADSCSVTPRIVVRYGEPFREIGAEIEKGVYDCVVTGGRKLSGIGAFKSCDLPSKLAVRHKSVSFVILRC